MITSRMEISDYLVAWLADHTGRPIGDSKIPQFLDPQHPDLPYGVLYTIGTTGSGPWADPDVDLEVIIQLTCVGFNRKQAQWMSDQARDVLVGRQAGDFAHAMDPQGFSVAHRWTSGLGATVRSGDRLFEVPDTYRIKVVPT